MMGTREGGMINLIKAGIALASVLVMTGLFAWYLWGLLTPEPQTATSVHFKNGPTDIRIFKNAGLLI